MLNDVCVRVRLSLNLQMHVHWFVWTTMFMDAELNLIYAHNGVNVCSDAQNRQLCRVYMGIHMQQEDEALEKFRFRNSMGHSLHADSETAPSTGFGYDWGGGTHKTHALHKVKVWYLTLF